MDIKRYDIVYDGSHGHMEMFCDGDYVLYEDIKHILERFENSDYAKCCEDIEKIMMYRGDMPEQGKLTEILKKHFAQRSYYG